MHLSLSNQMYMIQALYERDNEGVAVMVREYGHHTIAGGGN